MYLWVCSMFYVLTIYENKKNMILGIKATNLTKLAGPC